MNLETANKKIKEFFNGRQLTFCVERFGINQEEWVARCNEISAISTSGYGFDERDIRDEVKDAILTAVGVDSEYSEEVLQELSFANNIAVAA